MISWTTEADEMINLVATGEDIIVKGTDHTGARVSGEALGVAEWGDYTGWIKVSHHAAPWVLVDPTATDSRAIGF